jgi:hypothetical protein
MSTSYPYVKRVLNFRVGPLRGRISLTRRIVKHAKMQGIWINAEVRENYSTNNAFKKVIFRPFATDIMLCWQC